jgi:hypothetical protein
VSKVTEGCDGQMKNILIVGEDPGAPKSCENTSRLVGSTREVTIHAGFVGCSLWETLWLEDMFSKVC